MPLCGKTSSSPPQADLTLFAYQSSVLLVAKAVLCFFGDVQASTSVSDVMYIHRTVWGSPYLSD